MAQIMNQTTDTRFDSDFYSYSNDTSLQAYIERWTEGTYLQWKFDDDATESLVWDVEWIYLFILAFILYLAAAAIINKIKQRKKHKE